MTSTWSNLGLNLQGTGDNSGTWGQLTNVNLQDIDTAISGVAPITLTGNTTLAFTSNSSSTTFTNYPGLNKIIVLSGSLSATTVTVTVPNIQKDYVIVNNSGATVVVSSGGSTTISIPTSTNAYIYSNGSSSIFFALPLPTVTSAGGTTNQVQYNNAGAFAGSSNLTFNGTTLAMQTATALNLTATSLTAVTATVTTDNISTANINTANVTTLNVTTDNITTANVTTLNATTANLTTANVTTLKVTSITIYSTITATSVVTSASLVPTGVTSGSYTLSSITVSADGRITSASSGSAGGGSAGTLKTYLRGPTSGTFTANPTATKIAIYAIGAGGAYRGANNQVPGAAGGFGYWSVPVAAPFSAPYSIGAGGNAGPNLVANSGGATNLTNIGTANGGAGGSGSNATGNTPGANVNLTGTSFLGTGAGNAGCGCGGPGGPGLLIIYDNV